jgi:hypothetical protein
MIWAQKSLKVSDNGSGERTNCGGPFETRQTFWLAPSLIMTACETPAKISLSLLPFHLQMETSILWIFIRFRVTESFLSFRLSNRMEQLGSHRPDFNKI